MKLTVSLLTLLAAALLAGCATPPDKRSRGTLETREAAPPQGRALSTEQKALLDYHNKVRADVGVAPLRWDDGLAAFAQQWAHQLAGESCRMKHRQPNSYGENIFQGTAARYKPIDAAKGWESEKKLYHGETISADNYGPIGHYTQMVWRDTTQMGCGEALCGGTLLVVCNYNPPGNYLGKKPY